MLLGLDSLPLCWASVHKFLVSSELLFFCLQVHSKGIYPGWTILEGDAGREGAQGRHCAKQRLGLPVSLAGKPEVLKAVHKLRMKHVYSPPSLPDRL